MKNRIFFQVKKLLFQLACLPFPIRRKRLLIVRLDAIGDYVLFRNCLEHINNSERFSGYSISLLGNSLWKDLAEGLDNKIIRNFFWINPSILYNLSDFPIHRTLLLVKLKLHGFDIVLHPVHSRMFAIDKFISNLKSSVLIASSGDTINYTNEEKVTADLIYSELIPVPGAEVFEFYRNIQFTENLVKKKVSNPELKIILNKSLLPKPAIVISPGAGHLRRRWPAENFASVIQKLAQVYPDAFFYICGSAADNSIAEKIITESKVLQIKNMCGNQSLMEFTELMNNSTLLISNESSAIHIAAAVNIAAVCLSNGTMFGRFNPYPSELNKYINTLYADSVYNDPDKFHDNVRRTQVFSDTEISLLKIDDVFDACTRIMNENTYKINVK